MGNNGMLVRSRRFAGAVGLASLVLITSVAAADDVTEDLVAKARRRELDPVAGRDEETQQLIETLARDSKPNVALLGEPGVGKTAIVEGLAQRIASGNVPSFLRGRPLVELNVANFMTNTKFLGQWEEKFAATMQSLESSNAILFIDEAHAAMKAGAHQGNPEMTLANFLKPYMARGRVSVILATTRDEWDRTIAQDGAMVRRVTQIEVLEPDDKKALTMLEGVKTKLEKSHGVTYTAEALKAAVQLARRYFPERKNPDMARDLLDSAGARVKSRRGAPSGGPVAASPADTTAVPPYLVSDNSGMIRYVVPGTGWPFQDRFGNPIAQSNGNVWTGRGWVPVDSLRSDSFIAPVIVSWSDDYGRWGEVRERRYEAGGWVEEPRATTLASIAANLKTLASRPPAEIPLADAATYRSQGIRRDRSTGDLVLLDGQLWTIPRSSRSKDAAPDWPDFDSRGNPLFRVEGSQLARPQTGTVIWDGSRWVNENEIDPKTFVAPVVVKTDSNGTSAQWTGDKWVPRETPADANGATTAARDLPKDPNTIDAEDVALVAQSRIPGAPPIGTLLGSEDGARYLEMEEALGGQVMGQPAAVRQVSAALRRNATGLSDPNRPIGTFLFVGPSGVGKTELANALDRFVFPGSGGVDRMNMSDYVDPRTVTTLQAQLTKSARARPYGVTLMDEADLGSSAALNLTYQIADKGELGDGTTGAPANFRNRVLILTTNVGFRPGDPSDPMDALRQVFTPAQLGRFDGIIYFDHLTPENEGKIVDKEVARRSQPLTEKGIDLALSDGARDFLIEQGFSQDYGARELQHALDKLVMDPIATSILKGELPRGSSVRFDVDGKSGQPELVMKTQAPGAKAVSRVVSTADVRDDLARARGPVSGDDAGLPPPARSAAPAKSAPVAAPAAAAPPADALVAALMSNGMDAQSAAVIAASIRNRTAPTPGFTGALRDADVESTRGKTRRGAVEADR